MFLVHHSIVIDQVFEAIPAYMLIVRLFRSILVFPQLLHLAKPGKDVRPFGLVV